MEKNKFGKCFASSYQNFNHTLCSPTN